MVVGDLVRVKRNSYNEYKKGSIGLVVKIEPVTALFNIYWVLFSNDEEAPMWFEEIEVLNESRGYDNSS